jgi:hypothetical protein
MSALDVERLARAIHTTKGGGPFGVEGDCECLDDAEAIAGEYTPETLVAEQPAPVPNETRPIWQLVIDDMRAKHEAGVAKYGTPLQAHNGRDALVDLYQELLDACAYVRQAIAEARS